MSRSYHRLRDQIGEIQERAEEIGGNFTRWDHFALFDRTWYGDAPEDWCIVYTRSATGGIMQDVNAQIYHEALARYLGPDTPDDSEPTHDVLVFGATFWGQRDALNGYRIRVRRGGKLTRAFMRYALLALDEETYPVLDDERYSQAEYNAALENIRDAGERDVRGDAPEDWPTLVYDWLYDHETGGGCENVDDQGFWPEPDELAEALSGLGIAA